MSPATQAQLRRPNKQGFMAPFVVLEMVGAIEALLGSSSRDDALKAAMLHRLPDPDEPVREDKAARLHQAVRRLWPEHAKAVCSMAGEGAAARMMETQIPDKAQAMLSRMPRATGAWLLAKTLHQKAWTFSGTGDFVVESEQRFILKDNPILNGEGGDYAACHFHASLLERLFSTLIHPRLVCTEVACNAKGDSDCVFEFTMAPREPAA